MGLLSPDLSKAPTASLCASPSRVKKCGRPFDDMSDGSALARAAHDGPSQHQPSALPSPNTMSQREVSLALHQSPGSGPSQQAR